MRLPLITAAVVLGAAGPAAAAVTATATPNTPAKGTTLSVDIDTSAAPINGRAPSAVTLTTQPGFAFEPRAAAAQCTSAEASMKECPAGSQIGTATVNATAFGMPISLPLSLYVGPPTEAGDLATLIAIGSFSGQTFSGTGRILTSADGGLQVLATTPPEAQRYASAATVTRVITTVGGVSRTAVTKKRVKVRKKTKKHKAKFKTVRKKGPTYNLITTPGDCAAGAWTASAMLTFGDGTSQTLAATVPCMP